MSEQLAAKIEEVQRKRGELEETIRRVGEAFAAGLDRQEMVEHRGADRRRRRARPRRAARFRSTCAG